MSGRFRSFSFVDRITRREGGRVEGHFAVPLGAHFPASLMAEAVGQLAAWSAMGQLDFMYRPVAGLANAVHYHALPQAGINALLVERGRAGQTVVRLKGGDPFVFGRGGEECDALRAAGLQVEVVSGLTAGIAGPAAIGLPVTDRRHAPGVALVTGHARDGAPGPDWAALARCGLTLVVYMGVARLQTIVDGLRAGGMAGAMPVALVSAAHTARQQHAVCAAGEFDLDVAEQALRLVDPEVGHGTADLTVGTRHRQATRLRALVSASVLALDGLLRLHARRDVAGHRVDASTLGDRVPRQPQHAAVLVDTTVTERDHLAWPIVQALAVARRRPAIVRVDEVDVAAASQRVRRIPEQRRHRRVDRDEPTLEVELADQRVTRLDQPAIGSHVPLGERRSELELGDSCDALGAVHRGWSPAILHRPGAASVEENADRSRAQSPPGTPYNRPRAVVGRRERVPSHTLTGLPPRRPAQKTSAHPVTLPDLRGIRQSMVTSALDPAPAPDADVDAPLAVGALAKTFLRQFGIEILSHVIGVGSVRLERSATWDELVALSQKTEVLLGCVDAETEAKMKEAVDVAYRTGDTIGGIFEVVARGLPPGLGSHIAWDTRLDGKLAQAIVSMQAVKGVEVGCAEEQATSYGSKVQDTIHYNKDERRFFRGANKAGGLEGCQCA